MNDEKTLKQKRQLVTIREVATVVPETEEQSNEVNGQLGDTGLQPGETQSQNVSPGSSPASRFTSTVPIQPV